MLDEETKFPSRDPSRIPPELIQGLNELRDRVRALEDEEKRKVREEAYAEGVAAERARVVAGLRGAASSIKSHFAALELLALANGLEAGRL